MVVKIKEEVWRWKKEAMVAVHRVGLKVGQLKV
jgi:hypothetical protein